MFKHVCKFSMLLLTVRISLALTSSIFRRRYRNSADTMGYVDLALSI